MLCVSRRQTTSRPSGETRGLSKLYSGALSSTWRFAAGDVDRHQLGVRLPGGIPLPPAGQHRGAVRGQLERLLIQRPARFRGQVAQPGERPRILGPRELAGPVRLPQPVRADCEQPHLVRSQVVIPEPDRRRLVQDGGHPGVAPLLAQPGVIRGDVVCSVRLAVSSAACADGQYRRAHHDGPGACGHLGRGDPARQRGDDAGLTAAGRKQPQRRPRRPRRRPRRAGPAPGSGRREVNSSDPSGRNRGLASPSADRVSRRGGPPPGSIRHRLVRYFFPSALRVCTAAASQLPSGDSRSDPIRGMAT